MTHRRIIVVAAAGLLLAARPVRAQDARLAAIADVDVRASIGAVIVDAERRGLPREPLVAKALEGVEKGARPALIEAAVRTMVGRLAVARTLLSPIASTGEQRAVVDALSAGVPPEAIRTVSASAGGRPSPVAIGVLTTIVTRGVPAGRAAESVAALTHRRASNSQLVRFQQDIQQDLVAGLAPTTALDFRFNRMIITLPPPVAPPAATLTPTNVPAARP